MDDSKLNDDLEDIFTPNYSSAWEVSDDGCICYKGHSGFVIEANALTRGNRLTEVLSKILEFDNATTQFYFAFMQALKNAGYSSITIDLNDLHKSIIANK